MKTEIKEKTFTTHTLESAPEASKPLLEEVVKDYQFIPNLYGIFAESTPTLDVLLNMSSNVSKTGLTPVEQQIVYIVTSVENDCDYCVTGHSGLAKMMEIPDDIVNAIRNGQAIGDSKLNTLQNFVKEVMNTKGYVREESLKDFFDAGYSKANVLEVVLVLTQKVMSNYIGHITNVLIDEAFMPFKWKK